METTPWIWRNGAFVPWEQAQTHLLTSTLHYGAGVFEGVRCYLTNQGAAVFRLRDHMERLLYSAGVLKMEVRFTLDELCTAVLETLKENGMKAGYIRPLIYFSEQDMGFDPKRDKVDVVIACWPWAEYFPAEGVRVKLSSYRRIHPQSTVIDAKISGHYVNSILAIQELRGTDCDESLLLDHEGYVAEGAVENIFCVKDRVLLTPQKGSILPGITRNTILRLAHDLGYETREMKLLPEDLFSAQEAFFTGTLAEVVPIASVDAHVFPLAPGPVTQHLRRTYGELVAGRLSQYHSYLSFCH